MFGLSLRVLLRGRVTDINDIVGHLEDVPLLGLLGKWIWRDEVCLGGLHVV